MCQHSDLRTWLRDEEAHAVLTLLSYQVCLQSMQRVVPDALADGAHAAHHAAHRNDPGNVPYVVALSALRRPSVIRPRSDARISCNWFG